VAITTLDGVLAGMQPPQTSMKVGAATTAGRWYSPFYVAGLPGAAVAPTPGLSGAALTSYAGQIPWTNPVTGNSYLARLSAACNATGRLRICDRLWHNSGITTTIATTQTISSAAWPARDSNGSTNGEDIFIGTEITTAMGTGTPIITMTYTNPGNAGTKTGTVTFAASQGIGSFLEFALAAGDTGVRSIQSIIQSATGGTGGAYSLVAYRVLAEIDIPTGNVGTVLDMFGTGFPRLYDNTVPFLLFLPTSTTAPSITAGYTIAQG